MHRGLQRSSDESSGCGEWHDSTEKVRYEMRDGRHGDV